MAARLAISSPGLTGPVATDEAPEIGRRSRLALGKTVMHIAKERRKCGCLTALVVTHLVLAACGLLSGCGSGADLISAGSPTDAYRSEKWTVNSLVDIRRVPDGLRCVLEGDPVAKQGPYGGFKFPAPGAKGLRLDFLFTTNIMTAYVDGYNAKGARVFRFQSEEKKKLSADRTSCVFKPGQPVKGFSEVHSTGAGPIETFHVFVRIKPNTRASFEVANVERHD